MRSFRETLRLPGWSDESIWGYDEQMGTYFAQLWHDSDSNGDPTVWISGLHPIESATQLATRIASVTDVPMESVMRAMQCNTNGTFVSDLSGHGCGSQ